MLSDCKNSFDVTLQSDNLCWCQTEHKTKSQVFQNWIWPTTCHYIMTWYHDISIWAEHNSNHTMYWCDCAGAAIGWYRANCWGTTPPNICAFWMDDGEVRDFAGRTFNGILQTTAGAVSTGPLVSSYEWYMISLPTTHKTVQERTCAIKIHKQVRSSAVGPSKWNTVLDTSPCLCRLSISATNLITLTNTCTYSTCTKVP